MGVAIVALVIAGTSGAYASVTASNKLIHACIHHRGKGLYFAKRCQSRDHALIWRGAPKMSNYYTKQASDARHLYNNGNDQISFTLTTGSQVYDMRIGVARDAGGNCTFWGVLHSL